MPKTDPDSSRDSNVDDGLTSSASSADAAAHSDWHQLESFVDQLQEHARELRDASEFYRELLDGCVTLLAAEAGAVWQSAGRGKWQVVHQTNLPVHLLDEDSHARSQHDKLLASIQQRDEATVVQPRSEVIQNAANPTEHVASLVAVSEASDSSMCSCIIEWFHRPGSSPEVQRGRLELLETVALVAGDFHLHQQLRTLQSERGRYDQSLGLMRRFQQSTDLRQAAYEVANEGRRFVAADRLSIVAKRGSSWKLLAASGVDRIEARGDATKGLQELAAATAQWGEPLEYSDASAAEQELPPRLESVITRHIDQAQTRKLVAVPLQSQTDQDDQQPKPQSAEIVLVAEQFTSDTEQFSRQHVLEFAMLSQPALKQAMQLDRFPMRTCLRWADRWERVRDRMGLTKLTAAVAAALLIVAALIFVQVDYEVEATAALKPVVERDIFATADGKVHEVRITHGDQVQAGAVLALLRDPQLELDLQRVEGEIATTRKRLEAIAVARTDRQVREEVSNEKLPLSAEAEQLEKQMASLRLQRKILTQRQEGLTLRSPIAGTVLTLDVQNMLQSRPVQRGQVLFTVADTSGGWRLEAEVPQDRIGRVAEAREQSDEALPVRFRLAGETDQTYTGVVTSISTAAVVNTDDLDQPSPPFEVKVDIDEADRVPARPGMTAQAKIYCGRRSLGYVWLHDIWETVYGWLVF